MVEIVKLGYQELTFEIMYDTFIHNYYTYVATDLSGRKTRLKKHVKEILAYYYVKDSLLNEPINTNNIIRNYVENYNYKVVTIPPRELEKLLLKNQRCGYLTTHLMQDKEFNTLFDKLYPDMIKMIKFCLMA